MAPDQWFNLTTNINMDAILGVICFGTIFTLAIIYQFLTSVKIRKSNVKSNAFASFRLLFLAVTVLTISYLSDHLQSFLSGSIFPGNFSIFISILGYTLAILGLNIFLLRIINFRTGTRKVIRILAIIEMILMAYFNGLFLIASFIEIPDVISDYTIIIFGLLVIAFVTFTIISMLVESRNTANKMVKLRLRLAAIGTLSILIDGLANIIHIATGAIGIDDTIYYKYIIPPIALVVLNLFMLTYFYALFTPLWLQRIAGVLPPSFTDLMNKQKQLTELGSGI